MENKINVANLLKDCPSGMELDCSMYDNLYFDRVDTIGDIKCYIKSKDDNLIHVFFHENGCYNTHSNAKCVIFPKGKTTWEGFVPPCKFKDGDIVISAFGDIHLLSTKDSSYCSYRELWKGFPTFDGTITTCIKVDRLATEEEKQKLFDAIKDNGYKWDAETKTLEKLVEPKFNVGDVIQDIDTYKVKITEVNIEDECYGYESMIAKGIGSIGFNEQDNWELAPDKFDINTLKPFESRVLVRNHNHHYWRISFFGFFDKNKCVYDTIRGIYSQCIPYEGNEHLCGTTNDCDNYYKTW